MRSTAQHLCVEYMKHYRNGSFELCKMVIVASINFFKKTFTHSHCIMILTLSHHNFILAFQIRNLKKKGALPADTVDNIDPKMSPAQNFIILNRVTGCRRCLSPMSSIDSNFVNFSELELTKIFWQDPLLCRQLQEYAFPDFSSLQIPEQVSLVDVGMWIGRVEPGFLINKFLTDIGGYDEDERKKKNNFSKSARRMTLADIKGHLRALRQDSFDPSVYTTKGYLLRGSIKTDGFRLQVLSFKLNELNCVKYRRLPPDRLPDRITSTLGGADYFLSEVRNVVKTKEDIKRLWDCDPCKIKILGIDLGQAFVVGASALLPSSTNPSQELGETKPATFFNLAIKQKAVYQPTFKHRSWLEHRKGQASEGKESIAKIEADLPPLCGPGASIKAYTERLQGKEGRQLEEFYGNVVLKKHKWNAQKARAEEYRIIANRLLQLVGGSLGAKREDGNKVIIGIGLGNFSSRIRLSSLHGTFQSYFIQQVRIGILFFIFFLFVCFWLILRVQFPYLFRPDR
jgi:hypothetical protein